MLQLRGGLLQKTDGKVEHLGVRGLNENSAPFQDLLWRGSSSEFLLVLTRFDQYLGEKKQDQNPATMPA